MKKKISLIVGSLVAILALAIGVVTWKLGDVVAAYKPQIQSALSQALGTNVSLGDLSVSIIPRTEIRVDSVAIGDGGRGSPELFVGSLSAHAALLPLLQKRLEISTIRIDSPKITLLKSAAGMSVRGIPQRTGAPTDSAQPKGTAAASASGLPIAIAIQSIEVRNGELTLQDQVANSTVAVKKISLDAAVALQGEQIRIPKAQLSAVAPGDQSCSVETSNLSLNQQTMEVTFSNATLTTPAGSLSAKGGINPSGSAGSIALSANDLNLSKLSVILAAAVPSLQRLNLAGKAGMSLTLGLAGTNLKSITGPITLGGVSADLASGMKMRDLSGAITLDGSASDLGVKTDNLALKLQDAPIAVVSTLRIRPTEVAVSTFTVKGFGGELQAPSQLQLGAPQRLQTSPSLRDISLEAFLQAFKPDVAKIFQGNLTSFKAGLSNIELQNPAQTTSGNGSLLFKNGKLKGFNLPSVILSKIEGLPLVPVTLRKLVPPQFEPLFASPDTAIKEARSSFSIAGGVITIPDLVVAADLFTLTGRGTVRVNGQLDLNAEIRFTPEFSQALTSRSKELKLLLDADGRFTVPFVARGQGSSTVVLPDIAVLAQKLASGTLRKSLDGFLKGDKGASKSMKKILGF
jgi:uncharacterized protein involved in outer membrane biogenesis